MPANPFILSGVDWKAAPFLYDKTAGFMNKEDAIVNPVKGRNPPVLNPVALMVCSKTDINCLCGLINHKEDNFRELHLSRLYPLKGSFPNFSMTGPFIGAPYAIMLFEALVAWGVKKVLFYGWCGAVSDSVRIGDIIVASSAFVDEGTSIHYGYNESVEKGIVYPSALLIDKTKTALIETGISFKEGPVWSTDAIYRETPEKVGYFRKMGALAVEMELSAVFTAARFRNIEAAGLLVVSDEISAMKWRPGFREARFRESRIAACEALIKICQIL